MHPVMSPVVRFVVDVGMELKLRPQFFDLVHTFSYSDNLSVKLRSVRLSRTPSSHIPQSVPQDSSRDASVLPRSGGDSRSLQFRGRWFVRTRVSRLGLTFRRMSPRARHHPIVTVVVALG